VSCNLLDVLRKIQLSFIYARELRLHNVTLRYCASRAGNGLPYSVAYDLNVRNSRFKTYFYARSYSDYCVTVKAWCLRQSCLE